MLQRTGESIQLPYNDYVELSLSGVSHQPIERRTGFYASGKPIHVGLDYVPAPSCDEWAEIIELHFRILVTVGLAHTDVKSCAKLFHKPLSFLLERTLEVKRLWAGIVCCGNICF
jgi:hypothetical protein